MTAIRTYDTISKMLCTVRARYAVSSIRLMGAECTCLRIAVDVYNARNHCAFHTMNDRQLSLMMLIHSLQDGSLVKAETFYSLLQQTFLGNILRHSSDGSNLTISSTVCIFPKRNDIEEAHKALPMLIDRFSDVIKFQTQGTC